MSRFISALAVGILGAAPLGAAAAPSPSPDLNTVLAAPPSGYTELTSLAFHGQFTAHDYAEASDSSKASQIETTLKHDGFVDGFGKTWIHQSSAHALVEVVIAFGGGKGAKSWLTSAESGDKSDPSYDHAVSINGISPYYGGHFKYSSSNTVGDVFSFVKGNDVFIVGFVSKKDDVLSLATTQTKAQYDSAPKETIPSAQWPENASSGGKSAAYWVGFLLVPLVILVLVIAGVVLAMRRRGATRPAMAGAGGAMGTPAAGGAVQMSTDGNYWWDGQTWRDAAHEVPPSAQRSGDGALWWDGQTWRPVPGAAQSPPATPPSA